jgi:5-methylcytosine-specific restriction endonuclease McrA
VEKSVKNYNWIIGTAAAKKWPEPADREIWYAKLTAARRRKLHKCHEQQNGLCCYCGREAWIKAPEERFPRQNGYRTMATLEHRLPQMLGGTDSPANLAMACGSCNNSRGVLDFAYFAEVRSDPVKWKAHNARLREEQRERDSKKAEKSGDRRALLIWRIGLLFYLHTKYG